MNSILAWQSPAATLHGNARQIAKRNKSGCHLIMCNAHAADSRAPSTTQPEHIAASSRRAAVLSKIALTKTQQLQNLAQAASTLRRIVVGGTRSIPLLLSAAVVVPPSAWDQLCGNYVFMAGFWGWFIAQFLKIFTKWYKTGVFSLRAFVDSGGMPSSHSSLCSAVTTAIALQQGLGSPLFAICTCFSVIVMYDAMGVRRHAGLQAEVLNTVVEDLLEDHPVSERKLKEVLGHTPRQVLCGAALGITVGLLFPGPF